MNDFHFSDFAETAHGRLFRELSERLIEQSNRQMSDYFPDDASIGFGDMVHGTFANDTSEPLTPELLRESIESLRKSVIVPQLRLQLPRIPMLPSLDDFESDMVIASSYAMRAVMIPRSLMLAHIDTGESEPRSMRSYCEKRYPVRAGAPEWTGREGVAFSNWTGTEGKRLGFGYEKENG